METALWTVPFSIAFSTAFLAVACAWWMLLNWVWLKPKKLEKFLRKQGFSGNSYKNPSFSFSLYAANISLLDAESAYNAYNCERKMNNQLPGSVRLEARKIDVETFV
ncbi:hypothetical protein CUMW_251090 [Citrus unshiu]|uniref:Uncharacterized protein n=1 Tax=Citrus unshiu TaxID=55188 RepID=A0A2H5QQ22_CITUN|nr:hypothetical protein CUMW_251090 [Citrus unshiu]